MFDKDIESLVSHQDHCITNRFHFADGSVGAKFEYMAYSKLAAGKILNMEIFEFTYVYLNIHGHFVAEYRI
jgi:hypothetical protein